MNVREATEADLDIVTEIITLAFAGDPVWGPVFYTGNRSDEVADLWRLWVRGALRYPCVWLWNGREAVSVWIPPGGTEMSEELEEQFDSLAHSRLDTRSAANLHTVLGLFEANHPQDPAHYYLSLLGTHPAHRGRGAGMALLSENLARIDDEQLPAYLESSNPVNNARYARLGFEPMGAFALPDGGPTVTTMWRPAAAAQTQRLSC